MARKKQVSKRLAELGMAWAVRDDKFTDPGDPMDAQVRGEKTYHVHPDRTRPEGTAVKRFHSLQEIADYCNAVEMAQQLFAAGEYLAAENVMDNYWESVAY